MRARRTLARSWSEKKVYKRTTRAPRQRITARHGRATRKVRALRDVFGFGADGPRGGDDGTGFDARFRSRALKALQKNRGGDEEDRTPDLRIANATLSQLSYVPTRG